MMTIRETDVQPEPLIKDEKTHLMDVPNFLHKLTCSMKKSFLDVSSKSNCLDNSDLESLDFFLL